MHLEASTDLGTAATLRSDSGLSSINSSYRAKVRPNGAKGGVDPGQVVDLVGPAMIDVTAAIPGARDVPSVGRAIGAVPLSMGSKVGAIFRGRDAIRAPVPVCETPRCGRVPAAPDVARPYQRCVRAQLRESKGSSEAVYRRSMTTGADRPDLHVSAPEAACG